MEGIVGNEKVLSLLYEAARTERSAGCYLIAGAEGSGKRTVARLAAASLCCEAPREDGSPCLACHACRNILAGTHADVLELVPEEDKKLIPVERVRLFLKNTYVTPTESDWRVFIVDVADMNAQGQNAMLKSIEEVRSKSVFFLLTTELSLVLPTVRSRSVILRTESLSPDVICNALSQTGDTPKRAERIEAAARLCGGSLGKARTLLRSDKFFEKREVVLSYFDALESGAGFTKLSLIVPPGSYERRDLADFLTMMKLCLADLIKRHYDPDASPAFFPDDERYSVLSEIINPEKAAELFTLTEELIVSAENANVFTSLSRFHFQAQYLTKIA